MKKINILSCIIMSLLSLSSCKSNNTLQTVKQVDLNKYSGKWYEIAAYPQWFEKGCSNTTATYTAKDGYIEVFNSSIKKNKINNIKGKAFVVKGSDNTKLKVQFFFPFKGNYWIIDLADDYSWAVVSDPKKKTLWILSRTPTIELPIYDKIIQNIIQKGFDLTKLKKTDQSLNINLK